MLMMMLQVRDEIMLMMTHVAIAARQDRHFCSLSFCVSWSPSRESRLAQRCVIERSPLAISAALLRKPKQIWQTPLGAESLHKLHMFLHAQICLAHGSCACKALPSKRSSLFVFGVAASTHVGSEEAMVLC